MTDSRASQLLVRHQQALSACRQCPQMTGPVINGQSCLSDIMLIGQAPGAHEGELGKPFAWTAGKTLFGWFRETGVEEEQFRRQVYMAAVCRCFPGKNPRGGDRLPSRQEMANCEYWLQQELAIIAPRLILPVGKLAISRLMPVSNLRDVIGQQHQLQVFGGDCDVIPLPHPSGASTWHRTEPGKSLLRQALQKLSQHPAWQQLLAR